MGFVLDASGSMLGRIDGRRKFDVARESLRELAAILPPSQEVALRVYGHRKSALEKDADKDTALELPMNKWTEAHRKRFEDIVAALEPRGKTPLTLSLDEATRDLSRLFGGARDIVVLLTDGGEDTGADQDPVEAAAKLARRRNTELVVVGFDIDEAAASNQLRRMAEAAGGAYWPVDRAVALRTALQAAARQAPGTYRVEDSSGTPLAEVTMGESFTLEPGDYTVRVPFGGTDLTRAVQILPGRKTTVLFDPFAANPVVRARGETQPATSPVKFCTQCGTRAAPGAKFCTRCGRPLAR